MTTILEAHQVHRDYDTPGRAVSAVRGVSVAVGTGEYLAITGPSGSGKSTLLHLLGGIDTPTGGWIEFEGVRLDTLADRELTRLRLRRIGFVFQRFHLLPVLSARENVELPLAEAGAGKGERRARAEELLHYVGLGDRIHHRATELSGGEMQRVAIARALANRPAVILADEQILALFRRLNRDGTTIVVVTHDAHLAAEASRVVELLDGRVAAEQSV